MNGPEHYRKAEECFDLADRQGPSYEDAGLWLDLGIGHALLAIAAALAQQLADRYIGDGDHINAWHRTWRATSDRESDDDQQIVHTWGRLQHDEQVTDQKADQEWGPA
ncbi:hypothetical protein [Amycolatopsis anabasis]|uniref:hypothetical protein n=1 Tax=Amycolatopsis anabasis TaxID=1840409 RepID=UPI00131D371D|nr:hypothetical protein [Amycolatopsis anabasis]